MEIKKEKIDKIELQAGDRVTFDDGAIEVIRQNHDFYLNKHGVVKIERPVYKTLMEKKVILDEAEKRYLAGVIRPFKNKVRTIVKEKVICGDDFYINIELSETDCVCLPYFSTKSKMYKGMKTNKKYTLKELGLE